MNEDTPQTAPVYIPPELVLAILNSVDKDERAATICSARLVSHSWSNLLLRSLFRNAWITLTEEEDHNLDALCTFFATHPNICECVHSLRLYDKAAEVPKERTNKDDGRKKEDEVGEGDSDSSDGGYSDQDDSWALYRCSVDPDLLRRTLSHLPRLHGLRLHNIFPSHAATLDHGSPGTEGIRVQNLCMIFAGWDDSVYRCGQVAQLILYTLSIFDCANSVTVYGLYFDGIYEDTTAPRSTEPTFSPLRVQNLSCPNIYPGLPDQLARELVFSAISALETGTESSPNGLNALLAVTKSCLQRLKCDITNLSTPNHGPQHAIDLSVCNALNSLTLCFPLCPDSRDAHSEMVEHINTTLNSLIRRAPTASALKHFVLHINLGEKEPGDTWPLAREDMKTMEDILLNLVDQKVCSIVHVETDLQDWYTADSYEVRTLGKGKEELDSRWSRYVAVCEEALHLTLPRLDKQGLLAISTVPVTLEEAPGWTRY